MASPFETKLTHELHGIYTRSLLVLLFRTVVIMVGNDFERRCEQLFRQRPPASDKATPSGNTVSGQGLSQVKRRAGGFSHYVIIPLFVCFNIKTAHRPV